MPSSRATDLRGGRCDAPDSGATSTPRIRLRILEGSTPQLIPSRSACWPCGRARAGPPQPDINELHGLVEAKFWNSPLATTASATGQPGHGYRIHVLKATRVPERSGRQHISTNHETIDAAAFQATGVLRAAPASKDGASCVAHATHDHTTRVATIWRHLRRRTSTRSDGWPLPPMDVDVWQHLRGCRQHRARAPT